MPTEFPNTHKELAIYLQLPMSGSNLDFDYILDEPGEIYIEADKQDRIAYGKATVSRRLQEWNNLHIVEMEARRAVPAVRSSTSMRLRWSLWTSTRTLLPTEKQWKNSEKK